MFIAYVNAGDCNGCQQCLDRCQFDAIEMERPEGSKKYKAVVDADKCFGCGVCVITCKPEALKMRLARQPVLTQNYTDYQQGTIKLLLLLMPCVMAMTTLLIYQLFYLFINYRKIFFLTFGTHTVGELSLRVFTNILFYCSV